MRALPDSRHSVTGFAVCAQRSEGRALIVVDLGGWAAEKVILGEPTTSGDSDLTNATTRAIEMILHGLDPDAPFISHSAFGGYGQMPAPAWLGDTIVQSALKTLAEARDRALALAKEYEGPSERSLRSCIENAV